MRLLASLACLAAAVSGALLGALIPGVTPEFRDIAQSIGLTSLNTYGGLTRKDFILETTGNGVAIFDFDRDGFNDVLIVNGTRFNAAHSKSQPSPQLYHNDRTGHFIDVAATAGIRSQGWGQGVCVGDYDNDGHPDALITYYGHNILYRNRGDGTFEDATQKAGLPTTGIRYGSGCSFGDYDRDGNLDLFVSNYVDLDLAHTPRPGSANFCEWKSIPVMCGPRGLPLGHNLLYHNNGNGTFTDVSESAGINKPGGRYGLSATMADFDNDGWPDIYVACDMTPSLLFHNLHNGTFEERGTEAGVAFNFDGSLQAGMGIAVADYNREGRLDIAKTNFSGDLTSLFHNEDGKFFTDVSREAGLGSRQLLGWGISFIDFDDDGWPDLVEANGHVYPEVEGKQLGDTYRQPTVLYRNQGGGKFLDITASAGPAFQVDRPARGLAVGDLDGDGRPEIVIVNMNAAPSVLKNSVTGGHYLNVLLTGTKSNRSAIGARVLLTVENHTTAADVLSGGSFYSHNSFTLHFGLGKARSADRIDIRWPSGIVQQLTKVAGDQTLNISEQAASTLNSASQQ